MPAPYSDNLYSADDSDVEVPGDDLELDLDVHLSPTDGYFQSSSSSAGNLYPPQQENTHQQDNVADTTLPTSAGVPHVPNVLVQDPSLQKASSSKKDHEAREETRLNSPVYPQSTSSPAAAAAPADDFYDGASSIADSQATPSHTTYTYTSHGAQRSSSYTPYSPSTDAPLRTPQTHHPRRSLYSHTASLFRIPREAPPAYTPSPTSPLSTSSPTEFRNYRTFASAIMGQPEEESARLLGRDPESMGDAPYDDDLPPRPLPWKDRMLKRFPWASRRTLKTVLLAVLIFTLLTGFLSVLTKTVVNMPSNKAPSSSEPAKDPTTGLPVKNGPDAPAEPAKPDPSRPGPPRPLPWKPQSMCAQAEHRFETKVFDVAFQPDRTLHVLQSVETDSPSRGYQPHVTGDFVVRRQLSDAPGASVEVEVVANDERLSAEVEWDAAIQQLKIKTPLNVEWSEWAKPCMTVRATVWVPANARLKFLQLAALDLGVQLVDDLSVSVSDGVEIRTLSGDVRAPSEPWPADYRLDARNIVVQTISGDINGSWPLYDSLRIGSNSGDIVAGVSPQQVLESKPMPAVLEVTSVSGDVVVKEPLDRANASDKPDTVIPPRDYITAIETKSGGIRAWVAFSTVVSMETVSGDIGATVLPVYNVSLAQTSVTEPEMATRSKSGNVLLTVLEPMWVEISRTQARDGAPPAANPNEPVDIPTNPVPGVPNIPSKLPSMPRIPGLPELPFTPVGSGRRWSDILRGRSPQAAAGVATNTNTNANTNANTPPPAVSPQDQLPMRHLKSSHSTVSGNMKIWYPASWEGSVEAESISGRIDVLGKGVHIQSRTKWPKAVRAYKGQMWACSASLGSVSGNEVLIIGEE